MDALPAWAGYAITGGFGLILTLVGVVYGIISREQERHRAQLELKASHDQLKETKASFQIALDRQHTDYQERLKAVEQRQEREIELLNERMTEIKQTMSEMRKEQSSGTESILRHLQSLALSVRNG